MPRKIPFIIPYLIIACFVYSEQVGMNLHRDGKNGDIQFWYKNINNMHNFLNIFFKNCITLPFL